MSTTFLSLFPELLQFDNLQSHLFLRDFDNGAIEVFEEQTVLHDETFFNVEKLDEVDVAVDTVFILQGAEFTHNDTVFLAVAL